MISNRKKIRQMNCVALAAVPVAMAWTSVAFSQKLGTTAEGAPQIGISIAGSTALKNWLVAKSTTFTDIDPFDTRLPGSGTLSIDGNSYPLASDGGINYWSNNGGNGLSYQLAPKQNTAIHGMGPTATANTDNALIYSYHESGSVEGILEMVSDQISPVQYVTENVDRNPDNGNAVWVNYNQIGASGTTVVTSFNATTGASPAGTSVTLGNFYGTGVGQAGTPGETKLWVPGSASNPTATFTNVDGEGINVNGGQNAVQVAMSDAYPVQVFQNTYSAPSTQNETFNSNPNDLGYGIGNTVLPANEPLGTPGSRPNYQSPSVLNIPAGAVSPATGQTFGVGAWNNASQGGLGNLNSQLTAVTATAFVSNPGTGLSEVDRTDADWIETTSHFANGATFNMTTRDVNSGTRDVSSLDTGVDPTYSTGKNDDGNGNLTSGANSAVFDQTSIGQAMRFSNKTAGGAQLRPTVQNNRMAIGTLSINDAGGHDTASADSPVQVLSYSDSVSGASPYVSPNYQTIENGTYAIFQNEVAVTIRDPNSNYATNTVVSGQGGAQVIQGSILGDDNQGDVASLLNQNELSANIAIGSASAADAADGLIANGYVLPNVMQVTKAMNGQGLNNSVQGAIDTGSITTTANPNYNSSLASAANLEYATSLPILSTTPVTGMGSHYGDQGSSTSQGFYNGGAIAITSNNYLFGNFNQDGVRDFSAVKTALNACEALISSDISVGASVPGSEFTTTGDNGGIAAGGTNGQPNTTPISYTDADTNATISGLTKGDLIVMGDFNGDGHFDGSDLVSLAEGAALSTNYSSDTLASSTTMYQTGVDNKNAAMNYMNTNVPEPGAVGANATTDYIRTSGRAVLEGASIPFGATPVLNPITGAQAIDAVSGNLEYTYDPTGVNTFNTADVNQDGVIDFNDAVAVDNVNGKNPSNLADQMSATQLAPVSGTTAPLNLYMAQQVDGGGAISQADVNVINNQLTGVGKTNWYNGAPLVKSGPDTITWARTGGTVTVYPGATFNINNGLVQIGGTEDPFTDNNAPGAGSTAGNHVAVNVNDGAELQLTQSFSTVTVAGLTVNAASNSVLDLGTNAMIVDYSSSATDPISSIVSLIKSGWDGGTWTGVGITSSAAAANSANYGIGYADSADAGNPAGLASGQVEVKYTLLGDANLDGKVNGADFTIMAANFNQSVTNGWDKGDFNYDGSVNGADFTLLAQNFNQSATASVVGAADLQALDSFASSNGLNLNATPGTLTSVPEPASAGLLAVAGLGILRRRRRSAR